MPLIDTIVATLPNGTSLTDGPNGVVNELQAAKTWLKALIAASNTQEDQLNQLISNPSPGSLSFVLGAFRITCLTYSFNITSGTPVSVFISYPVVYSAHPHFLYMTPVTTGSTASGLPPLAIADDPTGTTGTQCIVTAAITPTFSALVTYNLLIIGLK